jgi:hypothetical protein
MLLLLPKIFFPPCPIFGFGPCISNSESLDESSPCLSPPLQMEINYSTGIARLKSMVHRISQPVLNLTLRSLHIKTKRLHITVFFTVFFKCQILVLVLTVKKYSKNLLDFFIVNFTVNLQ